MWQRASLTVEAALLMGIILPVLTAIIYAGFYVRDAAFLQGATGEVAAMGSNLQLYKNGSSIAGKLSEELTASQMLRTDNLSRSLSQDEDGIRISYTGTFRIPGYISDFWQGDSLRVQASWARTYYHPSRMIWKIRGAKALFDIMTGQ